VYRRIAGDPGAHGRSGRGPHRAPRCDQQLIEPTGVADQGQGTEKSQQGNGFGTGLQPGMNCCTTPQVMAADPDAPSNRRVPPVQVIGVGAAGPGT
jgi:hypothetical protein